MLSMLPKLGVTEEPAPLVAADPKLLFWVVGIVLGVLALWVLWVLLRGETRKPPPSAPEASSEGAE